MKLHLKPHYLLISAIVFLYACGGSSSNDATSATATPTATLTPSATPSLTPSPSASPTPTPAPTRSFYMGFTPWPYDATIDAVNFTYDRIHEHGDMVKHHLMQGIPWDAAYAQTAYPTAVENEINGRINATNNDKVIFLAIDSLNVSRNALVGNWSENGGEDRQAPWDTRDYNDAEVIEAYTNFALDMISRFQPEYFSYGTEVSDLILNNSTSFDNFVVFAEAVYTTIKAEHPNLKLMATVALKSPDSASKTTIENNFSRIIDFVDVVGISAYPYAFYSPGDRETPNDLPTNWISQIQDIAGNKPLAITETGWVGEELTITNYGLTVESSEQIQNNYVVELLEEANQLNTEFVIWFSVTDFDAMWNNALGQDDLSAIWKDTGLYDENLQARDGLSTWDGYLARERVVDQLSRTLKAVGDINLSHRQLNAINLWSRLLLVSCYYVLLFTNMLIQVFNHGFQQLNPIFLFKETMAFIFL